MIPVLEVPKQVLDGMQNYRDIFCKEQGYESICRFVTGLLTSPNKTLQGIHSLQVYPEKKTSRRRMHESVFESGWSSEALMKRHRKVVSSAYRSGKSKSILSLDWTFGHHNWGKKIFGVKKQWDYVQSRYNWCQNIATATISSSQNFDPIGVDVQEPKYLSQEKLYLEASVKKGYENKEEAQTRLLELLHHLQHQKEYRTIHEIFMDMVDQIEKEKQFPETDYAFDNGVLHLGLTQKIEDYGKNWVSELECSRNVIYLNEWVRIDEVAQHLKESSPQAFQHKKARLRTGEEKSFWVFSKVLRLKGEWGRKRIAIVHEKEDLSDPPRFLITNANRWNGLTMIKVWSYRWPCEIFHDFGKNILGLEKAQVRKKEAVLKHLRLACVSQSILNQTQVKPSNSEQFKFAQGQVTVGQKVKSIARSLLQSIVEFTKNALQQQKTTSDIMGFLMPT